MWFVGRQSTLHQEAAEGELIWMGGKSYGYHGQEHI